MKKYSEDSQSYNSNAGIQLSNQQQPILNTVSENNSLSHGNLAQLIQNFDNMNTNELDSTITLSKQVINDFSTIAHEIVNIINEGVEENLKQKISNYLNYYNLKLQQTYYWLLNNQNNSNCIFILGIFSYMGIEMDIDKKKAFELFQEAANLGNASGINSLGYCYENGIGTDIGKQKAFELYQKAANLGDTSGIHNLGNCYRNGIGTDIDKQKAFEFYKKAANLDNRVAQYKLENLSKFKKRKKGRGNNLCIII